MHVTVLPALKQDGLLKRMGQVYGAAWIQLL